MMIATEAVARLLTTKTKVLLLLKMSRMTYENRKLNVYIFCTTAHAKTSVGATAFVS